MKKVLFKTMAFAVMFSLTVSGLSLTNIKAEEQPGSEETKSYIVVTNNDSSFEAVSEEYGDTISDTSVDYENLEDENILITEMTEEEAANIKGESGVLIVEEDKTVYAQKNDKKEKDKTPAQVIETSVESVDEEWNMEMINSDVPEAEQIKNSQTKIKVALIDSGLDITENIDVAGRINLIPGEEEVSPLFEDTTGHGTFIAGIIAANNDYEFSDVKGINDQVELYSAKVLDYTNSAPISRVIEGIYWAISQDVDIINLSFSTSTNSAALHAAIKDAYNAGILVIAASGNSGGVIEYPAAYHEVMAVGSVDSNGVISDFCSKGEDMEVVAPGELIKSTGGFGGELIESGTSMAVPHVVGIASILWQKDKSKSADFIRQLINESANCLGDENIYGNGLVDLEYALEIYDEFASTYVPNTTISSELSESDNYFENNEEVTGFDDVSYVEGVWVTSTHESIIYNIATNLTSDQIAMIKWGATWPDTTDSGCQGMSTHPEFHGYYYNNNYLASYDYALQCSKAGYAIPISTRLGNATGDLSYMKQKIGELYYNLPLYGYSNAQTRLFVLGVAIHTGTDTYAHSAYNISTGAVINHSTGADNTSVCSTRYTYAMSFATSAKNRYFGNYSNYAFYDITNSYYSFTLMNYYDYVLQID